MGTTVIAVRATPINIPLRNPYHCSVGVYSGFSTTVIEVESSDGVVGIGEASSPFSADVINRRIAPNLIGADPLDLAACERRCMPPIEAYKNIDDNSIVMAWGGVEMALWDLAGRLQDRSIGQLLGGRVRDKVAFTEYFGFRVDVDKEPLDIARYCAQMAEQYGARGFEGKAGVKSLSDEIAMAREIRAAVGEDPILRLDANMAWSTTTAREAMRRLEPYNISSFEEPVRSYAELALLRQTTTIAFSAHDPDLVSAVKCGVPDAIVINATVLGGIRRTIAFLAACQAFGVDVWFYSEPGISTAAHLQLASAVPWIAQPSQTLARWQTDDVLAEGIFVPRDGELAVPDGPGLGINLDAAALARCHQRYLDEGPYNPYANPAEGSRWAMR
jgi:glucarate dehydratase